MKRLLLILFVALNISVIAQPNLIPDSSVELGTISGNNSDYYYFNNSVLWRAWPYIGFEPDKETRNSGGRSLKIVFKDYGSASFQPTFRCEEFPALEDATYLFSFYYKTDIDRSSESFTIKINEGTDLAGSVQFFTTDVPIKATAKDGFEQVVVEFSTGKAMDGILPFIVVPFIEEGAFMHFDDASLVKVVTTPKAWGPDPANTASAVSTNATLLWQSGVGAVKRNVYFGESEATLQEVATEITGNQFTPSNLENEKTYYWRVDEIDAADVVTTGDIWSFSTKTFYDEYMDMVKTVRIESDSKITWEQFGPGNAGFVNFLRYHPLLPDICMTSPDMGNTYQTEDNGKNWYTVKDFDGKGEFFRIYDAFYSTKTASMAIAIESSRLWTSQDTGRTWQNIKFCPWYDNDSEGNDTRSWYRKVSAVALDPNDDNTWYVGAGNFCRGQQQLWGSTKNATAANPRGVDSDYMGTIWKTTDAGQTWTALTNGLNAKAQFSRIIVHPENSSVIFAGSQYGLFKSVDAGATWIDIGEGKLDNNTIMNMDYYYDAQSGHFILYVADQVRYHPSGNTTSCDGGIFRSEDDGTTWTNINGNLYLDINQITGGVPYNYYQYIARWFEISTSKAQSQYPIKPAQALQAFNSINVDPSRQDALYVGFYDAQTQFSITPGRLWQTTDGGQNWINIARDYGPAWNADKSHWESRNNPYNDNVVMGHQPSNQQWNSNYPLRSLRYAAVNARGDIMILYAHNTLVSTDHGATFNQVDETYTGSGNIMGNGNSNLPGQCLYQDKRLGVGIVFLGSGEHHLWKSTNDGENGKQAAKYLNGSQESVFAVVTHPWDENIVYTTSMRQKYLDRIFRSTDGGETFEDWGKATEAEEWMKTNHLRIDPLNPDYMYFGVTEVAGSGGGSGTDGPDKDKEGGFHISIDAGKTFIPSNSGMPDKVWVRDIEFDPRDDTRASLFASAPWNAEVRSDGGLFHSSDRGASWTEIPVASNLEGINNIHFDHTGRMYATSGRRAASPDDGGLFYSDDFGQTWEQIFEGPFVENFDVSPFDHNILIISMGTLAKNPGIFMSMDRGKTWTKNNRIFGQPDRIAQVEFDLHDPTTIWLAIVGSGFYRGDFPEGVDTRKLSVAPGTEKLTIGDSIQAVVTKIDYAGELKFKTANKTVATVSDDGWIKGTGVGATKVWVTSEDGRYSDFIYLVVSRVAVTNITLDIDDFSINQNEEKQLTATISPENASDKTVIWESLDPSIASVDENGLVTGVKGGKTSIVVTSNDGSFSARAEVTVIPDEITGLDDLNDLEFNSYPNPVNERLYIDGIDSQIEISIYSLDGQLVKYQKGNGRSGFDVLGLQPGLYLFSVQQDDDLLVGKFIKE